MGFLKRHWRKVLIISIVATFSGIFLAFGPLQLMARTETPSFCASCHVMQSQFEAWFNVGAHRSIRCVDCHLPHDNKAVYYLWKSVDGMKDVVVFYSGRIPEYIEVSDRGKGFVQSNCIRCHFERVAMISQERDCWECHRFLQHNLAGVRLTR
jgi:cytochrome c nitrite reductase small subunit